jgi:hypothetical protein
VSDTLPVATSPAGPDQTFTSHDCDFGSYVVSFTQVSFG